MLDVGGGDQLDAGQQRASSSQAAEGLDHALAAVCAGAAPEADDDSARTRRHRGRDQLAHAPAVRGQRGLDSGRAAEQRQPAGLRALDVGRAGIAAVEYPVGIHVVGQRTAHPHRAPLADASGEHVDESGSAVGLRGQRQLVGRPGPAPALGDRLGGLHRGEAVAEAVGGDEHAEAVRAGHHSRLCWRA